MSGCAYGVPGMRACERHAPRRVSLPCVSLSNTRVGVRACHVPGMRAFERHARGAGVLPMCQACVPLSDMCVGGCAYHVPTCARHACVSATCAWAGVPVHACVSRHACGACVWATFTLQAWRGGRLGRV